MSGYGTMDTQYACIVPNLDMLPHHRIAYNDVNFTEL
jgi:hypothetical protein